MWVQCSVLERVVGLSTREPRVLALCNGTYPAFYLRLSASWRMGLVKGSGQSYSVESSVRVLRQLRHLSL